MTGFLPFGVRMRCRILAPVLLLVAFFIFVLPEPVRGQERRHGERAAEASLELAKGEQGAVMDRIAQLRAEIAQATGRVDVSPEGIRAAVEQLQAQQEKLMLDEAGAQGRREGLERAIKEYSAAATERASSDEAVKQLESVAALREAELKRKLQLQKVGAIAQDELSAAEAAVAQARADVAVAKHHAAGDTGPNSALDVWNRELMNLSIEQAERQARLNYIRDRLDKYNKIAASVDNLERVIGELRAIDTRVDAARQKVDELHAEPAEEPSAVTTQPAQPQGK